MDWIKSLFLVVFFVPSLSWAQECEHDQCPVSEKQYRAIQGKFEKLYPTLTFNFNWNENQPQAFASGRRLWMSGGFARKKDIGISGFLVVTCHEVGHALLRLTEGEADYFATNDCLKKYWQNENHSDQLKSYKEIKQDIQTLCDNSDLPRAFCIRLLSGSFNAANADKNRCLKNLSQLNEQLDQLPSLVRVPESHYRCLRTDPSIQTTQLAKTKLVRSVPEVLNNLESGLNLLDEDERVVERPYHQHNSPLCRWNTLKKGAFDEELPLCWHP